MVNCVSECKQLESSFSGVDNDGNVYTTNVTLDFSGTIDEKNDYFVDFVDVVTITDPDGNVIKLPFADGLNTNGDGNSGNSQNARLQVRVTDRASNDIKSIDRIARTGAHEAGHTLDLEHNDRNSNSTMNGIILEPENLMRQSRETSGTVINSDQRERATETIENET